MSASKEKFTDIRERDLSKPKEDTWLSNATDGRVRVVPIQEHGNYIKSLPPIK